jgi:hypothetical protein
MEKLKSYFDAAALVTLCAAAMYFIGYRYHVAYLGVYGLTTDFFRKEATEHIVVAWESALWFLMALATFLFFRAFVTETFPQAVRDWFSKSTPKSILSMGWFLAFILFILAGARMEQKGKSDALTKANARRPVKVLTTTDIKLPEPLYFLHYGDGKYVFYYRPAPGSPPTVLLLRADEIRRIDFPSNSMNERPNQSPEPTPPNGVAQH